MPSMDLVYRFLGVDAGAGAQFDRQAANADKSLASWQKLGIGAAAAAATIGVVAVSLADKFETAQAQLEGAIKNVGGNFGALQGQINATNNRMQALGFTNTDTETGLAGLVVATKNTQTAISLMGLAADIARGRNMSLVDATTLLVKVETGHVALLGRLGINTKTATGATISQQQAIQRLTQLYGGDASRFAETFSGKLQVLRAQAEDLGVRLGLVLIPAVELLITALDDAAKSVAAVAGFLVQHKDATIAVAAAITGLLVPALVATASAMAVSAWETLVLTLMYAKDAILAFAAGEDAATASALDFDAALGPIAIALAAAGAVAAVVWERQKAGAEEAKQAVDDYVNSLHVNTQSVSSVSSALAALKTRFDETVAAMTAGNSTNGKSIASLKELGAQIHQLTQDRSNDTYQAQQQAAAAALSHQPLSQAAQDFAIAADKTTTLTAAITSLDNAWGNLVGNLVAADQARTTVINDEKAWKKAIDASNGSISNQTKLGQAARTALDQLTTDVHAQSDAITNNGGSWREAAKPIQALIRELQSSPGAALPYVKKLVDGLHNELSSLHSLGQKEGENLDAGLVAGLRAQGGQVETVAAQIGRNAALAVGGPKGTNSGSPSKITTYYGQMLAQGLIVGFTGESSKIEDALTTGVQNALNRLHTMLSNALNKAQSTFQSAQKHVQSVFGARNSAIGGLAGTIAGSAGLSGLFGTDANGNPTTANVGTFLSAQVGPLKQFAQDLKWAANHHMSPVLLSQIANLGAVQGDQVLKQFMSGQASIAQANAAERQINAYSRGAASTAEDAVFARSIAKAEATDIKQYLALEAIRTDIHKIAEKAGKEIGGHYTLKVETDGKLKLTPDDGREIIKIIRRLDRTAGHKLI